MFYICVIILRTKNMDPKDANTKKCKVVKVVYNCGDFSYAYLYLADEDRNVLGCRWNYNYGTRNELGSPNQGRNPKWLYMPDQLYYPILESLVGLPGTDEASRIEVIQAINDKEILKPIP